MLAERAILAAFADADVRTRAQLSQSTGLSRAVVAGVVETLVRRGELTEVERQPAAGTRGRPSARYRRSALLSPVLLIHLRKDAGTTVSVVGADGSSRMALAGQAWDSPWKRWAPVTQAIAAQVAGAASATPRMVVIAVPFPVRDGGGQPRSHPLPPGPRKLLKPVPPQPDWLACDPRPAVAGLLRCQVIMVNDANLAALGEAHFGAAKTHRGVVHLSVRDGIGAGFVFGGALLAGANGFAGELAHVQVDDRGDFCGCGNRGCLATEVSNPSVLAALAGICGQPVTFEDLQALITAGDAVALRYLRDLGVMIGRPMATLVTALDPDCIVVDGSLGQAVVPLAAGLTAELSHRCPPMLMSRLSVLPGTLANAVACGAVAAANTVARSRTTGIRPPFEPVPASGSAPG
jgi:predicted NBD/HSP70 family sugar kinase